MSDEDDWDSLEWQFGHAVSDAYKKGRKSMQAELDAAVARAEAAEHQAKHWKRWHDTVNDTLRTMADRAGAAEARVDALTAKLDALLAVAQQVVENAAATCDRMWVSDAELADMARAAIAKAEGRT